MENLNNTTTANTINPKMLINIDRKTVNQAIVRQVTHEKNKKRYKIEYASTVDTDDVNSFIYGNNNQDSIMVSWLYVDQSRISAFSTVEGELAFITYKGEKRPLYVSVIDTVEWKEEELKYLNNYSVKINDKILAIDNLVVKRIKTVEGISRFRRMEGDCKMVNPTETVFKLENRLLNYNQVMSHIEANSII